MKFCYFISVNGEVLLFRYQQHDLPTFNQFKLTMSSFSGCMNELENILVDNFTEHKSFTCFFLTHCHTDHMTHLGKLLPTLKNRPHHFFYCSPISRLILLNMYGSSYDSIIKPIHSTRIIVVPKNDKSHDYEITVTPIPAGHCPGSVMFLFETGNKSVLFTGDFRIAKNDIQKFKRLHRNNEVISIDKLYFDATFFNESFWDFPQRSEVVNELKIHIRNWLGKNCKNHVLLITSARYGYEDVFTELAKEFKCKIHVKNFVYDIFWNVPEVGTALTNNFYETKIHAGMSFEDLHISAHIDNFLPIRLSALWYKSPKKSSSEPIWKKFPNEIRICYSTHCSCSELLFFLNYLHPKRLEPLTSTVECSDEKREEYIQKLVWSWPLKDSNKRLKVAKNDSPKSEERQNIKIKFSNFKQNHEVLKEFFMKESLF